MPWPLKKFRRDDGLEGAIAPNPHFGRIDDALLLELEGDPVVDIVADVLLVRQHLVDGAAGPRPAQIRENSALIQHGGDLRFDDSFFDKDAVHPANNFNLVRRARHENDAVRLNALLLSSSEDALLLARSRRAACAEGQTRVSRLGESQVRSGGIAR